MMANFRELITKWAFHVEHEPLHKVEEQLEKINEKMEMFAAAEVIHKVYELTEQFTKFAEEIHVAAESAGITVEAFQKLSFAASKSAVSQEEMSGAMARLSRHLYDARTGGKEAQEAFQRVGFSQAQVASFRTGKDVMMALADQFKGIQDPIKKQALAMELMGRGSVNMVGFLSQGSAAIGDMGEEAEKLGIVLSEGQVHALVEVEHAMVTLFGVIKGIGAYIASVFAPSITTMIERWLKFIEANKELLHQNIRDWAWKITYAMGYVYGAIEIVVTAILKWIKGHQTLATSIGAVVAVFTIFTGALWAGKLAWGVLTGAVNLWMNAIKLVPMFIEKVKSGFEILQTTMGYLKIGFGYLGSAAQWCATKMSFLTAEVAFLEAPVWLVIAAIGLLVVAIHDIWEAAHGRPGWVQQLLEWAGLFDPLMDIFAAIYNIILDIINLDFSKLLGDVMGDVKDLVGFFTSFKMPTLSGITEKLGLSGPIESVANVAHTIGTIPGMVSQTAREFSGPPAGSTGDTTINQDVNIEVNVPPGTDHRMVGDKVKEGVREHLDRVQRETHRTLRPTIAY